MMINGEWLDNITCPRCQYRHPSHLTCEQARNAARDAAFDRVDAHQVANTESPPRRENTKHVPLPHGARLILGAFVFHNTLVISCDNGVFIRNATTELWDAVRWPPYDDPTARMHG